MKLSVVGNTLKTYYTDRVFSDTERLIFRTKQLTYELKNLEMDGYQQGACDSLDLFYNL